MRFSPFRIVARAERERRRRQRSASLSDCVQSRESKSGLISSVGRSGEQGQSDVRCVAVGLRFTNETCMAPLASEITEKSYNERYLSRSISWIANSIPDLLTSIWDDKRWGQSSLSYTIAAEGQGSRFSTVRQSDTVLGPKLLLVMGCVKLGEKNCVHLPSVGEQTANQLPNFTQPMGSNNFRPSTLQCRLEHFSLACLFV